MRLCLLVLLLAMKLSGGYIQWQFNYYSRVKLDWLNGTCRITGIQEVTWNLRLIAVGVLSFLGPLFGAVLAYRFGLLTILRGAGLMLWLPGIGLIVSYFWTNLTCQIEAGYPIWMALHFALGAADPALLMMLISMGDVRALGSTAVRVEFRGLLMMLYYAVASVGQTIGIFPYLMQLHWAALMPMDLLSLAACFVFTASSLCLRSPGDSNAGSPGDQSDIRISWIKKSCQVVAFAMPLAAVLIIGCNLSSAEELKSLLRLSHLKATRLLLFLEFLPTLMYCVGTAITCVLIAAAHTRVACSAPKRADRLQAGLILEIVLQTVLFTLTAIAPLRKDYLHSDWAPYAVLSAFSAISIAEGVSNALTVAGMYELMVAIATPSNRAITIVLAMTTWSVAIGLTSALMQVFRKLPDSVQGVSPAYFLRHIVCLGLLLLSLLHLNLLTLPLSARMELAAQSEEEADDDQLLGDPSDPVAAAE